MKIAILIRNVVTALILVQSLVVNIASAQDDGEIEKLRALIAQEVDLAAEASYHNYVLMRIEALALEFNLNSEQLKKPKLFARKQAAVQLKQCRPSITRFLSKEETSIEQLFINDMTSLGDNEPLRNTKVIVNRKTIANKDSPLKLEIEVDLRKRWISSNSKSRGHGSWLEIPKLVNFNEAGWRTAFLGVLTPDQLADHQQKFEDRESKALALASIRLATNFRFTSAQEKQVQSCIYNGFKPTNQSTIGDLESELLRSTPMLLNIGQDFLTDSQKVMLDYANGDIVRFKQNNQVKNIEEPTIKEAIEAKVRQEIFSIVLAELRVELDDYLRVLKPASKTRKRWLILIGGIAERQCDDIFENSKPVFRNLRDSLETDVIQFVWKGVTYQLKDQDESDGKQTGLSFGRTQSGFRLNTQTDDNEISYGFNRKRDAKLRLEDDRRWKFELSKLESKQIKQFKSQLLERKRSAVIDGLVKVLTVDLVLSEEQQDLLRKRLDTNAGFDLKDDSNYVNAINTLKRIQSLDFLSEPQKAYFQIVKARLE